MVVVGENTTWKLQFSPTASESPQPLGMVLFTVNAAEARVLVMINLFGLSVSGTEPVLVKVTVTGALLLPSGWVPKAMLCGERNPVGVPALTPIPDTATDRGALEPVTLTDTRPVVGV